MSKETKIWGTTECLVRWDAVEVHHLKTKAGGYCSIHRHGKVNIFHVVRGEVAVTLFEPDDNVVLTDGQGFEVPTMRWHRFKSITDAEVIEVYLPAPLRADDIERRSEGGMESPDA